MKNEFYRISDTNSSLAENRNDIEFYCCQTNELNPTRDIMELGIVVTDLKGLQIDFSLDQDELNSLINYLTRLYRYNEEFNNKSFPDTNL